MPNERKHLHQVRSWNGRDFYVVMGNVEQGASRWDAGAKYGFVGAGGGTWYSKPLRNLTPGKRIFAYVGGAGYVGVGEVTGSMTLLRDLEVDLNGKQIRVVEQPNIPSIIRETRPQTAMTATLTEFLQCCSVSVGGANVNDAGPTRAFVLRSRTQTPG